MGKPSFSVGRNMDHPHLKGRFTLRLWIPSEQTWQLVARGHQSLHGIKRKAHVKSIECSAATDDSTLWSPVVITGDPTCAFRAYQALSRIVDEIDSSAIAEFPLHPRRHPILVGPGGSTLKRISADNSVRIFVPDNTQTQNGSKSDRNIIQLEGDVEPIFSSLAMIIEAVYGFRATTLVASGPAAMLDTSSMAPSSTVSRSPPVPSRTSSSPSANATVTASGGGRGALPVATHVGNPSPGQQSDNIPGGKRTEAGGTGNPDAEQLQSKPPATWASSSAQSSNVQPAEARKGRGSQQTQATLSKPSSVPIQGSGRANTGVGESNSGSTAGTSNAVGARSNGGPPTPQRQHQPRSAADKARGQKPVQGQQQGQRRIESEAGTGPSRGPQRSPLHRHGTPSAAAVDAGSSPDAGSTVEGRAHVAAGGQNANAKGSDLKDWTQSLAPTQTQAEARTHGHPKDARGGAQQQVSTKDQTPPRPPVSQKQQKQQQQQQNRQPQQQSQPPPPPPPKQQQPQPQPQPKQQQPQLKQQQPQPKQQQPQPQEEEQQSRQQQQDRQELRAKGSATMPPPGQTSGGGLAHDQGCNRPCPPAHLSGSRNARTTQQPSHASRTTSSEPEQPHSLPRAPASALPQGPQVQQPNPPVAPTARPSTSPQTPRTTRTVEDSAKSLPKESQARPARGPRAQGSGDEHNASADSKKEAGRTAQGSSADVPVQEGSTTAPPASELKMDAKSRRYEESQGSQESSGKPRNIRGRGQVNSQLGPGGMIQPLPGPLPSAERSKETVDVPASVVSLLQGQSKRAVPIRDLPKRPILKDIQKYTGTIAVVTESASSKDGAEGSSSSGVVEEGATEGNTPQPPPRGKEGATEVNGAAQDVLICIEGPTNCVEVAAEALRMLGRGDSIRNALNFLKRTSPQRRLVQLRRQEQEDRQNRASTQRRVDPGKPEAGAEVKEGVSGPEKAAAGADAVVDQSDSTQGAAAETERPGVAPKRDPPTQQDRAGRQREENAHPSRQEKNDGAAASRETGQASGGSHRYQPRDGFKRPYRGGGGRGSQRTPRSQREGGAVGGRGGESSGAGENGWGERGPVGSGGGWSGAQSRGSTDTGGQKNGWGDPDPVESSGGWGTPQPNNNKAESGAGENGWGKPGPVDSAGGGWDKPETSSGARTGSSGRSWGKPGAGESNSGWNGSKPRSGAGGRSVGGRSRTGAQHNGWGGSESGNSGTRNGGQQDGWGEPGSAEPSSGGWNQSQSKSGTGNAAQENGCGEPESVESTRGWGKPEANAGGTGNENHQNGWGEPGAVESTSSRNDSRSKGAEPPSRGARVEGDKSTTTRGPPPGRPYKPRRSGPSRSSRPGGPPGGRGSNGGRGRGGVLDGGRSGGRGDGDAGRGGGGRGQGEGAKSRDRDGDAEGGGVRSSERRAGSGARATGGGRGGRSGAGRENSGNGKGGGRGSAANGGN